MIVKFVDDGSYFVELDGPTVVLKSVDPIAASATIQVNDPSSIDDGDYFLVNTPEQGFYVWMDKSGDTSADPTPEGLDPILVDISGAGDAAAVAAAIQTAVNDTSGFSATVNSEGDVEIDVDTPGRCDAPSDYNTQFTFIDQLDGDATGGTIKRAVPNGDSSIVEVYDADYDVSTDTMTVLCKIRKTASLGKDVGVKTEYRTEAQTVDGFVWG